VTLEGVRKGVVDWKIRVVVDGMGCRWRECEREVRLGREVLGKSKYKVRVPKKDKTNGDETGPR
jgi:hypothetical protein